MCTAATVPVAGAGSETVPRLPAVKRRQARPLAVPPDRGSSSVRESPAAMPVVLFSGSQPSFTACWPEGAVATTLCTTL